MASTLRKIPFTEDLLPVVADFDCGSEVYEVEVSDWIKNKGPGCVLDAMNKFGTQVWLYVNDENEVVGFGSLGTTKWNWPESTTKPRIPVNLIPAVAIRKSFWGKPEGPPEERYSTQMMRDLIAEARKNTGVAPVLGLFVHPRNEGAIRLYRRMGFAEFHQTTKGDDPQVKYEGRILRLD
jgi:GNAT superfamily N-acetyltransferase